MSGAPANAAPVDAAGFAFLDGALDRAEHLREDPAALDALWPVARVLQLDSDGRALTDAHGALPTMTGTDIGDRPAHAVLLGLDGTQSFPAQAGVATPAHAIAWFALRTDGGADAIDTSIDLRSAAATWPAAASTAFAQARALLHWQSRHRHCGVCGGATTFVRAGWMGRCTQCGVEHYPRTDPAVIVAVSDGTRLLLGRQASWPPRRYSTLAGFVEPGESLEQTVAREVFEESGVRVRSSRYLASQPWPFPSSLMLGLVADAAPDAPVVGDELEDARWFTVDEIGAAIARESRIDAATEAGESDDDGGLLLSPRLSISRWLIERWHAERTAG